MDGKTDGRTENRTPIPHFAKAGATKINLKYVQKLNLIGCHGIIKRIFSRKFIFWENFLELLFASMVDKNLSK